MSDNEYRATINPLRHEFEIETWPFYQMVRLVGLYHLRLDAVLKPIGMDVPRWRVLMILAKNQVATVTRISAEAVTKMSTMAKIIQRMAAQDLVGTRISAEDARSTEVFLTEKGWEVLEKVRDKVGTLSRQAFQDVSDEELRVITAISRKIHDNLAP